MKVKRNKRFHFEVATASLNDIMFFLLLFFLIVSTIANPNVIKLLLPSAKSTQVISKQEVSISVTEDKHFFIDQVEVPFDQIETVLTQKSAGLVEPTVIIRMPYNLQVQDLVDVMQICVKLKLKTVLATQKK